jgi:hypothetical protein
VFGRQQRSSCHRASWFAACIVVVGLGTSVSAAAAAAPTGMVDLGAASTYAALSGASVGNVVSADGAPHTTLRGNLGVKADVQPTGFPPGIVTGTINIGNAAAAAAHTDMVAAYTEIAGRTGGVVTAGAMAGAIIGPGLHTIVGAGSNTTTLTLDAGGDPNAVFVFQVGGALAMAAGSHVVLTGGAQASRVFWQVQGAGSIGANATFAGTLIALDAVGVGNGTVVNGRVFARNGALTLDDNDIYSAPPVVTIAGGGTASTTDTTPTISGTTDVEAPATVTVTVNGQTLTATPVAGAWSVTSALLANATYPVVASVTDGAGNPGSATQQLTVDTVPPVITLDGGPSVATNDPSPTLSGSSDVAPGTHVQVTVGADVWTAVVQAAHRWNVTPDVLPDGTYTVTAAVSDPAGNRSSATQALTVDTTPPALTVAGGSDALTADGTPAISGTAGVVAGTAITATIANQTLSGTVLGDGTWSLTAAALADGTYRVVVDVTDKAGNAARFTQMLTDDTVAPAVTITGGAAVTTSALGPTIAGTSDAAPGTTVTVTIAGATMTTLVQGNGTWNVTPPAVGAGTWTVVASVPDAAGNVGRAQQALTIAAAGGTAPPPPTVPPEATVPVVVTTLPAPLVAPAPTPGPTPTSRPDATTTTVAPNSRQRVITSTLSIGTKVTAPAAGGVRVTATGTIRLAGVKATIKLTSASTALAAGHSITLKLKPRGTRTAAKAAVARIRAALRAKKRATATITVKIVDAAGHVRQLGRTVTLTT